MYEGNIKKELIETTVGRVIFNKAVPEEMGFINAILTKKSLRKIISDIVKRTDVADNGKIVVALIDNHEAMLKRIRRKGKSIALESANKNYETKIFGPNRVKIQGVLVSLYRNF